MPMMMLDRVQLHYREDGDPGGMPVVFANSLGTDMRLWDSILPRLPAGLRLIRFDMRGHGLSSCPPAPYAMDDLVVDIEALLARLGVDSCVFVGLSIGGMIGQSLAARRPDLIRALVLSNTAAQMGDPAMWKARIATIRSGGITAMADAILERWFAPEFHASPGIEAWRNMLLRTPVEGYIGCCEAIAGADLTPATAALKLPTLGIAGALDGASPPERVKATIDLIPAAGYVEIEQAGHLPCVEAPAAYAAHLSAFLEEVLA